jgi:ParB/RepB/Spo0J family partition protein
MAVMKKIPLVRIIDSDTDRSYGGEGNLKALAESIRRHGIINPVRVRESANGGTYQIIAGRRRVKAAALAGLKEVPATVAGPDDSGEDGELALAENVNRLDMDPLDEAETFAALLADGEDVKEIALRYERSTSAIYQRARLAKLAEGLKELFHGGKLTLSQAAVLAGLGREEQEAFLKEHGKKASISAYHINSFLYQTQHCKLEGVADGECEACPRRTRNTDPELFDDYRSYEDVCFDEPCWRGKWEARIGGMIAAAREGAPGVDAIICSVYALPDFLEELLTVKEGEKQISLNGEKFRVLCYDDYEYADEDDEAGIEAFVIQMWNREEPVSVRRFIKCGEDTERKKKIPLAAFAPDIAEAEAPALAEAVNKKYESTWEFEDKVKERVLEKHLLLLRELEEEPRAAVIDEYFKQSYRGGDNFKKLYAAYTGKKFGSYSKAFKEHSAAAVFFILRAACFSMRELPDRDDLADEGKLKKNAFMKFSGLAAEEYRVLFQEAARELAEEAAGGGEEEGGGG